MRLFEAMQMGVAPVIISDGWILPNGPAWGEFAIVLPEDTDELEALLIAREPYYEEMGRKARAAWERFFAVDSYFDYLVDQAIDIRRTQWGPERQYWRLRRAVVAPSRLRLRARGIAARLFRRYEGLCRSRRPNPPAPQKRSQ